MQYGGCIVSGVLQRVEYADFLGKRPTARRRNILAMEMRDIGEESVGGGDGYGIFYVHFQSDILY